MTNQDIIQRASRIIGDYDEAYTFCNTDEAAQALADAGLLRDSDQQRNERMAADATVYADLEDARAERDKAMAERNMAVGKVDEMRQRLAQVRAVVADLDAPNPEADQDWHDDPVRCIRDALHIALDREAQS